MGPKVNVKMQMVGDLDTDLRSEFTSAGINQTLHRIYLEIKCKIIILTPFETMEEEIAKPSAYSRGSDSRRYTKCLLQLRRNNQRQCNRYNRIAYKKKLRNCNFF